MCVEGRGLPFVGEGGGGGSRNLPLDFPLEEGRGAFLWRKEGGPSFGGRKGGLPLEEGRGAFLWRKEGGPSFGGRKGGLPLEEGGRNFPLEEGGQESPLPPRIIMKPINSLLPPPPPPPPLPEWLLFQGAFCLHQWFRAIQTSLLHAPATPGLPLHAVRPSSSSNRHQQGQEKGGQLPAAEHTEGAGREGL